MRPHRIGDLIGDLPHLGEPLTAIAAAGKVGIEHTRVHSCLFAVEPGRQRLAKLITSVLHERVVVCETKKVPALFD